MEESPQGEETEPTGRRDHREKRQTCSSLAHWRYQESSPFGRHLGMPRGSLYGWGRSLPRLTALGLTWYLQTGNILNNVL
ncbi:hypothetical protein GDO86_016661 [Hymenochirus boettgeri]|uniref:Uncharacterized protein n=1 Tax=Hymenochirus boettgeri TaxID=247094 RepID=A0A8T2K2Q5_9PIPI|nr:hypothetical protein GDO86_016661 [Hymenochirus boettgeri]